MRKLIVPILLLIAVAVSASAPSASAYSSTDRCDSTYTYVDQLERKSTVIWHLEYYFSCAVGDGPRVGLQRKGCSTCAFSTIFALSTTNGEGVGNLNWADVKDEDPADQCETSKYYRMFLQWYDSGAYHIDYSPWHQGTAWTYC